MRNLLRLLGGCRHPQDRRILRRNGKRMGVECSVCCTWLGPLNAGSGRTRVARKLCALQAEARSKAGAREKVLISAGLHAVADTPRRHSSPAPALEVNAR